MEKESEKLLDEENEVESFLHITPSSPNLTMENKIREKFNRILADFESFSIKEPMEETNDFIKKKQEELKNENKANLVALCKNLNLPASGKKEILIERLIFYHRSLKEWKDVPTNFSFPQLYQNVIPSGPRNMTPTKNPFEIYNILVILFSLLPIIIFYSHKYFYILIIILLCFRKYSIK